MEMTDFEDLRTNLYDLRTRAEKLLDRLDALDTSNNVEKNADAKGLLDRFVSTVEDLIASRESNIDEVRTHLKRFLDIVPPDDVKDDFEPFKEKLSKLLESKEPLSGDEKPYELFVSWVDNPQLDPYTVAEDDTIDTFNSLFKTRLTKLLPKGMYHFESVKNDTLSQNNKEPLHDNVNGGKDVREDSVEQTDSTPQTSSVVENIENIKDKFVFINPTKGIFFGAKAFEVYYFNIGRSGTRHPKFEKFGELNLLGYFAQFGALTKRQLKDYLFKFNMGMWNAQLELVCKKGYVSIFRREDSDVEFYALSLSGLKIFKTETTRDLMKKHLEFWSGKKPLGMNSELMDIYSDVKSYERTTTVALKILSSNSVRVRTSVVARIRDNTKMSTFELSLYLVDGAKLSFFLRGTSEKVFLSHTIECSGSETIGIPDCLYCVVSDDHTIEYFDSENSKIDFDAFIKKLSRFKTEVSADNAPEDAPDIDVVDDEEAQTDQEHDDDSEPDVVPDEEARTSDNSEIAPAIGVIIDNETWADKEPETAYDTDVVTDEAMSATDEIHAETSSMDLPSDPFSMAKYLLENNITPSNENAFNKLVDSLLDAASDTAQQDNTDYIGRAVILRKTLALADNEKYGQDYKRLRLAVDMPLSGELDEHVYSYGELSCLFYSENAGTALHLAALLRALFRPSRSSWVYDLRQLIDSAKGLLNTKRHDDVFSKIPDLKNLLNTFTEITSILPNGFTVAVINQFIDDDVKTTNLEKLKTNAKDMCKTPTIQHFTGAPEMMKVCFGSKSDLGTCMEIIANDQRDFKDTILKIYKSLTDNDENSTKKIDLFIDNSWKKVSRDNNKVKIGELKLGARDKTIREIHQRLDTMKQWLEYVDELSAGHNDKVKIEYEKMSKSLENIVERLRKDRLLPKSDRAVILRAVENLSLMIKGNSPMSFLPEDWLAVGVFPVSNGVPIINENFCSVLYYEPWRNVLRHISYKPSKLTDVLEQINSQNSRLRDNIGQAIAICDHLGLDDGEKEKYQRSVKPAIEKTNEKIREFEEKSGLNWFYGRIDDQTRELVIGELERFKPEFLENKYFACLPEFLDALHEQLADAQKEIEKQWNAKITEIENMGISDEWTACFSKHIRNSDFLLVEEAINVYHSKGAPSQVDLNLNEEDLFSEFIDNRYKELEHICLENTSEKLLGLKGFAEKYISEVAEEYRDSAKKLLTSLPNETSPTHGDGSRNIETLLKELGFTVVGVTRDNPKAEPARFTAKVEPEPKNSPSYKHPIAAMGTNLGDTLHIIELFGKSSPHSIIDTVRKQKTNGMPLVFLNGFLTGTQRRQLAKIFLETHNAEKPFIFLDWILLLHLASQDKTDRIRVMLACTMPFTGVRQLFSAKSGSLDDEMYIGRMKEIREILNMTGTNFVYGGRQLGKTAMLMRARNLFPKDRDHYSVYIDCNEKECHDETSFVNSLNEAIKKVGISLMPCGSIKDLCAGLQTWLTQKKGRHLLLLIDESDNILRVFAEDGYVALKQFHGLQREINRFKFVFAGLHNVFLAAKAAKDANTVFGQFNMPICIRPLEKSDAYKLLTRPLRFLGFKPNPQTLLPLLVNTVFYPGVVHSVGYKLISMLIDNYSDLAYNDNKNPPYQLEDEQIRKFVKLDDLSKMIEERIIWTLEVDASYYLLASCIAALYYLDEQNRNGYSIEKILECAEMLDAGTLQEMEEKECENLLSELCDMSILVKVDNRYRFRLSRFLKIVGKSVSDIEKQIKQYLEQKENG
ncbi:MAG: hypothetical protein LBC59_00840 [Chitinispirillales bacterium]|jgi:Asp-tRNA(Asn)/Glu-tRNA(Gln) amidotransferase C subunit|nr:hypothetical protein [Chitinispirillales bacterium]